MIAGYGRVAIIETSTPPLTPLAAAALRVGSRPSGSWSVGCGDGEAALFLAREFPRARVRGVDPLRGADRARRPPGSASTPRGGSPSRPAGRAAALPRRPLRPGRPVDARPTPRRGRPRPAPRRIPDPGATEARRGRGPLAEAPARLRRQLRARGLEQVEAGEAGDGSFSVARLAAAS